MHLAILSSILLLWAAPVHAGTVAIVRPPSSAPDVTETLSRIHGELLSVGLEVKLIDRPAGRDLGRADSRAWLEEIAAEGGIDAVIDIVGDMAPVVVDVWVIEKSPRTIGGLESSPRTEHEKRFGEAGDSRRRGAALDLSRERYGGKRTASRTHREPSDHDLAGG